MRPLLQSGYTYQRFFIQLASLLKGCSKYFRYLNMHFSVFHYIVQKQKYLKKIGTRPLSTETILLLSSQPILLVLRALCLSIFVKLWLRCQIVVRPLCTETIFLLSSQPILLVLRALCLSIFVKLWLGL